MALRPTPVFDQLWHWMGERWKICEARRANKPSPWTTDVSLSQYKYTNVFRELDKESQACILITVTGTSLDSFAEQFLRTMVFKTFSLKRTWDFLEKALGVS